MSTPFLRALPNINYGGHRVSDRSPAHSEQLLSISDTQVVNEMESPLLGDRDLVPASLSLESHLTPLHHSLRTDLEV